VVSDEIADREIDLVADGGDRRRIAGGNGARDTFVVECPHVLA
jgi:hypothetical protein